MSDDKQESSSSLVQVLGQVALKILLDEGNLSDVERSEYVSCVAAAARKAINSENKTFASVEDIIIYTQKFLDRDLLDILTHTDEKKLQEEREAFKLRKAKIEQALDRERKNILDKEREQLHAYLKLGNQKLEKLRVELSTQEEELEKEKQRLKNEQDALIAEKEAARLERLGPIGRINERGLEVHKLLGQADITQFLTHVYRGNLEEVQKYLTRDKNFVSVQGDITDLSGRVFKQITAFQYAHWAMDIEMCELILRYMLLKDAKDQWIVFYLKGDYQRNHGNHFSLLKYLDALKEYSENCELWDRNLNNGGEEAKRNCWYLDVGGAQGDFPAWMIMLMSQEGMEVAWLTQDLSVGFYRDEKYLEGWFVQGNNLHLGGKPISSVPQAINPVATGGFSWGRGRRACAKPWDNPPFGWMLEEDYKYAFKIELARREALARLDRVLSGSESLSIREQKFVETWSSDAVKEREQNLDRGRQAQVREEQKMEEELQQFQNEKNAINEEMEYLIKDKKQLEQDLERKNQELELMRLEIQEQLRDLEEGRLLIEQQTLVEDERIKREKQGHQALIAQKQDESVKKMSPGQLVNYRGQEVGQQLDQAEIDNFLTCVYRRNLDQVQQCLERNRVMCFAQGNVTDLSERKFGSVTGFQYAYWALDIEMCELILHYLSEEEARIQLLALERERADIVDELGEHYCFDDYLSALKKYIDYYEQWEKSNDQRVGDAMSDCWTTEVASAHRDFPSWLIMLTCEDGALAWWHKEDLEKNNEEAPEPLWFWFDTLKELGCMGFPKPLTERMDSELRTRLRAIDVNAEHSRCAKIRAARLEAVENLRSRLFRAVESSSVSLSRSTN